MICCDSRHFNALHISLQSGNASAKPCLKPQGTRPRLSGCGTSGLGPSKGGRALTRPSSALASLQHHENLWCGRLGPPYGDASTAITALVVFQRGFGPLHSHRRCGRTRHWPDGVLEAASGQGGRIEAILAMRPCSWAASGVTRSRGLWIFSVSPAASEASRSPPLISGVVFNS